MHSQQRFAGIKGFICLFLPITLLLLLDQPSIRLVNGQLEAVGAVLSVVPVTSILTTAGLVGVKLAALSRLLQALGYDQAYLKSGNPGTAALPIGLQSNHAYMFPYVPGLNISVREEHGTRFRNDAAHLREAAAHLETRKTFPAMGLPGDYESQKKPFRGSETLKDIFKSAGINVKLPNNQQLMQQQAHKTNLNGQTKGKGQSQISHSLPIAVTAETAKSSHASINLQPAKTNHHDPQHQQLLPSPSPTHENVAYSPPSGAVVESWPYISHPHNQPLADHQQAAEQSSVSQPSFLSSPMAPEASHPQQPGQQPAPEQQAHIPQTHSLQSLGQNSQVSLAPKPQPPSAAQLGPIHTPTSVSQPHSPLSVAPQPATPPAPVPSAIQPAQFSASSLEPLTIPSAFRPSLPPPPPLQQQFSPPPPPPPSAVVPTPAFHPTTPNPPSSLPATVATGLIDTIVTSVSDAAAGNHQRPTVSYTGQRVDPNHQVPQRELIHRKFLAELKANQTRDELLSLLTQAQQPVYAGPDPFHPVPQHEPFYKKFLAQFRSRPAQSGSSLASMLPPPQQPRPQQPQQQQSQPEGPAVGSVVAAPSLQSGHLVRPPQHGIAHIPQRNLANFEDYNNILFGAGASPNSLQFSSSSDGGGSSGSEASAPGASSANGGNSGGGAGGNGSGSTLATGNINIFPSGHSASDISSNLIPTPFVTDGPPPFHDEMDQNEFNLVNIRRRRKRQIAGADNVGGRREPYSMSLANKILSQARKQSSRAFPPFAGVSQQTARQLASADEPRQSQLANFGMPAVNINRLRRRKRWTHLLGSRGVPFQT